MGLTGRSVGRGALDAGLAVTPAAGERVLALAGNPNVGKSTVFNGLTGLHQHTGNWPGKTVSGAQGRFSAQGQAYLLVDVPGTYSLAAHSAEEEVARDFICFGGADGVVVVCDATCLERNLRLVLQILETGLPTVVCVNLLDEAKRRHITLDLPEIARRLGTPVCGTAARKKRSLVRLTETLQDIHSDHPASPPPVTYAPPVERALAVLTPAVAPYARGGLSPRFLALQLLEEEPGMLAALRDFLPVSLEEEPAVRPALAVARRHLEQAGLTGSALQDSMAASAAAAARAVCRGTVEECACKDSADRRIDRIVTSRRGGYPLMILLLLAVFWLTIRGANAPSQLLTDWFARGQAALTALCQRVGAPEWLHGALVLGVYRVLAAVVAVMLPPMAIFFPLFTLLEDVGYLPRIAYNLDRPFHRCHACGKQALTMCMGFGCNAAGVVGCRIVDSPRERLLAILTNSFVPCNGRFPTLVTLLTLFFVGSGAGGSLQAAVLLTGAILLGVLMTLLMTRLLSATVLRGMPSSFTLELPPYRRPQVGQILLRSVLDRTLFVLGRAAAVAAPAGLLLWLLANVSVSGAPLLSQIAAVLDPFARLLGLDGVILLAFILGFPANEIVLPIALMAYTAGGTLPELGGVALLRDTLTAHGWTGWTAASAALLCLFHWPCSTTLLTVRRETGSWRWTALAAALPTAVGVLLCMAVAWLHRLCG